MYFCNKIHFFVSLYVMMDYKNIVEACRKNDAKAQKELYDLFAPMMMGVCMRYTHSREEAQDVLQDAFVKVFLKINALKNPQALEDWVYNIVVRTALNHVKRGNWSYEPLDDTNESVIDYSPYAVSDVMEMIQQLPDKYRVVFNLREIEGYEFDEISKELHMPHGTVRSILCRAKKMLKDKMLQ